MSRPMESYQITETVYQQTDYSKAPDSPSTLNSSLNSESNIWCGYMDAYLGITIDGAESQQALATFYEQLFYI